VDEIIFQIETCEESGVFVASWDAPAGQGGITTQGRDLRELQDQVTDAVRCHFDKKDVPRKRSLLGDSVARFIGSDTEPIRYE
jgi:hypothetical protein